MSDWPEPGGTLRPVDPETNQELDPLTLQPLDTGDAHLDAIEEELLLPVLLAANPHKFGPGKVHVFKDGKTRCGKTRENTPGKVVQGTLEAVTCKGCLTYLQSDRERERKDREWQQRRAEWEAERQRKNERWWRDYDEYLQTPEWRRRRDRVMYRAGTVCEGCLEQEAVMVHHLTYERVRHEMLFDLVAICRDCHGELRPGKF